MAKCPIQSLSYTGLSVNPILGLLMCCGGGPRVLVVVLCCWGGRGYWSFLRVLRELQRYAVGVVIAVKWRWFML